ncbi:MAG: RNA polymerase subunit sigma [Proteobacteria bacterium]|nr:MAG: RNA polymerase subunit sigma [Pseudomonadota bacterium]
MQDFAKAAAAIEGAKRVVAFTGAGISVESGIPPFRGANGLWAQIDPSFIELSYFLSKPNQSWELIRKIFYEVFDKAEPNDAHRALAALERAGKLDCVITQNIDNLHQEAGNTIVHEYHGTAQRMLCLECGHPVPADEVNTEILPPRCAKPGCGGILKPDFIFFGEAIPEQAARASAQAAGRAEVMLVIGTAGEVMPACGLPHVAKEAGATIIEINPERSAFTSVITDIHLCGTATEMMRGLLGALRAPLHIRDRAGC